MGLSSDFECNELRDWEGYMHHAHMVNRASH